MKNGRSPEDVVGNLSEKTPQMSGAVNIHHDELFLINLLGRPITMDGRPVIHTQRPVSSQGKIGINVDLPPETKAFNRWNEGKFLVVEKEHARQWRAQLQNLKLDDSGRCAIELGIAIKDLKSLEDVYRAVDLVVGEQSKTRLLMKFIFNTFFIPAYYHREIMERLHIANVPALKIFAPYVSHMVKVELFFQICTARSFISPDRPSNKIDIAYLYYLPFCNIFVSGDKLHKRAAPYFLRKNQEFIFAPELKEDLSGLNLHYQKLPTEIREQGIMSFASRPPYDGDFLTAKKWDKFCPGWRSKKNTALPLSANKEKEIVDYLKQFRNAPPISETETDININSADCLSLSRNVSKKRGSWYQIPKNFKHDDK